MRVCYLLAPYISHRKAGISYLRCLQSLGVTLVPHPAHADVVIIHDEPWTYPEYYRRFPDLRDRYTVAYAVWEGDRLPIPHKLGLTLVNEVWTPSRYCAGVFEPYHASVHLVPHVVEQPPPTDGGVESVKNRFEYRPDVFYFYTVTKPADARKNLNATLSAFARVSGCGGAGLIVKVNGGLSQASIRTPHVQVINDFISESELSGLHSLGHCFVSAHCSEGWGMGLSEAMARGNLAIATGFGGNTEFMRPDNSLLVRYSVETIRPDDWCSAYQYWPRDMRWAYVDEDDLTEKLRFALTRWPDTEPLRTKATVDMHRYSPEAIAEILKMRLMKAFNLASLNFHAKW